MIPAVPTSQMNDCPQSITYKACSGVWFDPHSAFSPSAEPNRAAERRKQAAIYQPVVGPEPRPADTPWHTGMAQTGGLTLSRPSRLGWQWSRDPHPRGLCHCSTMAQNSQVQRSQAAGVRNHPMHQQGGTRGPRSVLYLNLRTIFPLLLSFSKKFVVEQL